MRIRIFGNVEKSVKKLLDRTKIHVLQYYLIIIKVFQALIINIVETCSREINGGLMK